MIEIKLEKKHVLKITRRKGDTSVNVPITINKSEPEPVVTRFAEPEPVVDCKEGTWGPGVPVAGPEGEWTACVNSKQSRREVRTREILTQPSGGGRACGPKTEEYTVTRDCVVVEPDPTTDENVILIGSAWISNQFRIGPADRAKLSVLRKAIDETPKWTTFADAQERISPSRNGVRATKWVKLPVWGSMNGLYKQIPRLRDDGTMEPMYPTLNGDFAAIMQILKTYGTKSGPRGTNVMTPYCTWHGHSRRRRDGTWSMSPHIPYAIGLTMDGVIQFAMRDGSMLEAFRIPGANATTDFTYYEPDRKLFFVTDSLNKRVLMIGRHPAFTDPANPNFEDFSKWQVHTLSAEFVKPTSIREIGGTLYVADNGANAVYKLGLDGAKLKVLDVPGAFWIDGMSDGRLIVAALTGMIYIIDPKAPSLGNMLQSPAAPWVAVDNDKNGTCGPKDEFVVVAMTGGTEPSANVSWRRYQDGILKPHALGGGSGIMTNGDIAYCQDVYGHYPWPISHHPDEGTMMVAGLSDVFPSLLAARPDNYPAEDAYDAALAHRGRDIIRYGAPASVPYGKYPSFTCQMSDTHWSLLGCTGDWIAQKSFADAAAFVQGGMFGSFPRPEIKGRDLHAVLYPIYRSSQRFLREGAALMNALKAFCLPLYGQELPAVAQRLPNVELDVQMDVRVEAGNLAVKFSDRYGHPKAPEAGLVVRLIVDEGLPEQRELGTLASPWTIPVPALPKGQHSLCSPAVSGVPDLGKYKDRATMILAS